MSMAEFTGDQSDIYELYAVVEHIGKSVNKGHYRSWLLVNGRWWCANDNVVFEVRDLGISGAGMWVDWFGGSRHVRGLC